MTSGTKLRKGDLFQLGQLIGWGGEANPGQSHVHEDGSYPSRGAFCALCRHVQHKIYPDLSTVQQPSFQASLLPLQALTLRQRHIHLNWRLLTQGTLVSFAVWRMIPCDSELSLRLDTYDTSISHPST